jgi:hypothetical protein
MHVEEGDKVIILLIDFVCRDRSGDDLAESAVLTCSCPVRVMTFSISA